MEVYRIVHEQWSKTLMASGNEARWNTEGKLIIYTSASRALACLENFVHRSGEASQEKFITMIIELPNELIADEIKIEELPKEWRDRNKFYFTQRIGNEWLRSFSSAILKVTSAIIPEEHNYLLNPEHNDFRKIKVKRKEKFAYDPRMES